MKSLGVMYFSVLFLLFGFSASGASSLEELKMEKRFGIGFSAGGPLSILGIEADVNFTEQFSVSGGVGTGLDYNSLMLKARYSLLGKWVSPYFAAGFARWWSGGTNAKNLGPSLLTNTFLPPGYDTSKGFDVCMVYPAFGVEFMHPAGVSFFGEVQYLFKLFDLANGFYGGLGMHWYF
jgi:hypothetical protein